MKTLIILVLLGGDPSTGPIEFHVGSVTSEAECARMAAIVNTDDTLNAIAACADARLVKSAAWKL